MNTKNIIISGGNGILAQELVRQFLLETKYDITLVSRTPGRIAVGDRVKAITIEDLCHSTDKQAEYQCFIHTAFSRSSNATDLLDSLNYQKTILENLAHLNVRSFVNISSQSVYGKDNHGISSKETTPISPSDNYAKAKAFAEVLVSSSLKGTNINFTSIRLASLISARDHQRFINKLILGALSENQITVFGGSQQFSFIDVADAASALIELCEHSSEPWRTVYNLGCQSHSLSEIASLVAKVVSNATQLAIPIAHRPSDAHIAIGMDSSRFYTDFGWQPTFTMEISIQRMLEKYIQKDHINEPT